MFVHIWKLIKMIFSLKIKKKVNFRYCSQMYDDYKASNIPSKPQVLF